MLSDEWLPRYRLLENFTAKWNGNGNGNAYDRGDYNSSFALRAVELKRFLVLVLLRLNIAVNDFSIMSGWSHCFLGSTTTFWGVNVSLLKDTTLWR